MTLAYLLAEPHLLGLAVLTTILGAGRLTRVIVHDAFPPAIKLRMAWDRLVGDGPWSKLFHCWWCMSFWVTLFCVGWYFLGQIDGWAWVNVAWWVFWGTLAMSYVAAIIIARDEPSN
jgi:hypothetical protein